MQANQLRPPKGAKHARKRIGRGNASGHGTYSTKGLKGQKARSGRKPRRFFEGGQTRLMKRLPRAKGFTNPFRVEYSAVNLVDLERFDEGTEVTPELLKERGVLRSLRKPVKVLANGELSKALTVRVHKFSMTAREKIEAAGGKVEEISGDGSS
jgi:large subunit ribosomal protein L15